MCSRVTYLASWATELRVNPLGDNGRAVVSGRKLGDAAAAVGMIGCAPEDLDVLPWTGLDSLKSFPNKRPRPLPTEVIQDLVRRNLKLEVLTGVVGGSGLGARR